MKNYLYKAVLTPNELGGFDVYIPDFDCRTQGDDLADAAYMAHDLLETQIVIALEAGKEVDTLGSFDGTCPDGSISLDLFVRTEENISLDETMTVQEAADLLDLSRARIYAMIEDGRISSIKSGNMRLVDANDVMNLFNNPRSAGRPKKELALV